MVDDFVAGTVELGGQPPFDQRHSHGVAEALAQGAGGYFHAGSDAVFRMAGSLAAPLAEPLELVHRKVVPGQMEQ